MPFPIQKLLPKKEVNIEIMTATYDLCVKFQH